MTDTLIVSVSGVRGIVGKDLTPELMSRFGSAMGILALGSGRDKVVVARDARTSGPMYLAAVRSGLQAVGCGVIDCGMIPTPTAQLAVEHHGAGGGIVITASHNPVEWNALKFIGPDGVFLEADTGRQLGAIAKGKQALVGWDAVGGYESDADAISRHVESVLALSCINIEGIKQRGFTVALDCAHGVGGTIMPKLLEALGCRVVGMEMEPHGRFTRPPEPVPEHLDGLGRLVRESVADIGMAVDPDGDRLALTDETGDAIGEDFTLAFAVGAVLAQRRGPVVVNLSTSLVVDEVAAPYGIEIVRAPVGEANVARVMRSMRAVVGGEGNGGVMLPDLHLGRDALVAAALVLHKLEESSKSVSELVAGVPSYVIVKAKVPRGGDLDDIYAALASTFTEAKLDRQDGMRLEWDDAWLHVRPSGTEPVIRLIAEARSLDRAESLIDRARTHVLNR